MIATFPGELDCETRNARAAPPWSSQAFLRNAVFDSSTGKRADVPETRSMSQQERQSDQTKAPENQQGKPDAKPHG